MNLINNRYRVVGNIKKDNLLTSYIVIDVMDNYKVQQLSIINSEVITRSKIDFLIEEFLSLTNIENSNIIKLFNFGLIYSIDGKKINKKEYFYTKEYAENNISFNSLVKQINEEEVLNIFIKLCKGINYLHVRGFVYGELNIQNIVINKKNNIYNILLKDIPTIEIEKEEWKQDNITDVFKNNESITDNKKDIYADIYALGILLIALCGENIYDESDINKKIDNLKNKVSIGNDFYKKIINIIERIIFEKRKDRYETVGDIVNDINTIFNKNYLALEKNDIEKLIFKTKIIARDYEIKKVISVFNDSIHHKSINNNIVVHGEQGIGKTRLLKELTYIFNMKKIDVYSSFLLGNKINRSNIALVEIFKNLVAECDNEIVYRYESELINFIPELAEMKNIDRAEILEGEKEKYRLISRLYSFIKEAIKNKTIIFIIDNAHCLDEFSIDFLEYFNSQTVKDKNIISIISYNDTEYFSNNRFYNFINKNNNYIDIKLEAFNSEYTSKMIQEILSINEVPRSFANIVYNKTYGNPLFIEETLKDFLSKKLIYVNDDYIWETLYDSFEELPIAPTMEQALLNQIKEIDDISYEILSNMSVFNIDIPIQIIHAFNKSYNIDIEKYIDALISKGILSKKADNRGCTFNFSNKVLKNLIYERIDIKNLKDKHKQAAEILEEVFKNDDEIIYHLEKSGDNIKAREYCIENAYKMERLRIMDRALSNYKKALSLFSEEENIIAKIDIVIKIGDLYSNAGNLSKAIEIYNDVYDFTIHEDNKKLQVDMLNKLASVYQRKNELEKTLEFINKADVILKEIDYINGYLENRRALAIITSMSRNYEKSIDICKECISLCTDEHLQFKAFMHNILGVIYYEQSKIKDAVENYNLSRQYFEQINDISGMVTSLNNIGVIYSDYYQDSEKTIKYFTRVLEMAEENNIISMNIYSLINLASAYLENLDYDLALKYFNEALDKTRKSEIETNVFYIYNCISYVLLKLDKYREANEYYIRAEKELIEHPNQGKLISIYYQIGAELYYKFGEIDKSYDLLQKALYVYNNDRTTQFKNANMLIYILSVERANNLSEIQKSIEGFKFIIESYGSANKSIDSLYDMCIVLINKGFKNDAINLLNENILDENVVTVDSVKLKGIYLRNLIKRRDKIINEINTNLELARRIKDKLLKWKILSDVGDYYINKKNYFYAANYYFEACEIIKTNTLQVPEDKRVKFFNYHDMINPFYKFNEIKNLYTAIPDKNKISHSALKDLNNLFSYDKFVEILNNDNFISSAKNIYRSILPEGISSIRDLIINMTDEPTKILDIIIKILASDVLATKGLIILRDDNVNYSVIASTNEENDLEGIKVFLEKVEDTKKSLVISEAAYDKNNINLKCLPKGIKAIMCIFIMPKVYIYMESETILNNFNENSLSKCMELKQFIRFIINTYKLKLTANIDKLTQTLTRKAIEEVLENHIQMANMGNGIFSIVIFDLDNFKGINDKFGHQTGDDVLKKVTNVTMDSIRDGDVCGRYGGEEFILILKNADSNLAFQIAERVRKNIENKDILGDKRPVTVSMGIATYKEQSEFKQQLIEKADQALYVAKENGKNRCEIWKEDLDNNKKYTNKLSGIINGNLVQDSRKVLVMVDFIELIKEIDTTENKIFNLLGRIIEITEAEKGLFFKVKEGVIKEKYSRKIFEDAWSNIRNFNEKMVANVITTKQEICTIDWDDITGYDPITGIPEWNSVIIVPMIKSGAVKGVIYLTTSIKIKEFKFEDLNFVKTLAQLAVAIL
ncbi:diguanylate cyclase (GGDEF) domain-containing protein [Clostridium cavendishii DSM 21758]|uniref:Diguanylate cyclase (GGDEF) domain-containing protein n=1 Tax=Clostridium cavendishii DSM 21758 TaxID=1121302 RepID=A0A1M6CSN2_9CLOT|nr:diguanylate cyclase [Clostridium cavendishii]SHI63980.1 diguanylate cyclase (GGDEF) domain-containing protein [Clostridium cavendishii DSM 21758]